MTDQPQSILSVLEQLGSNNAGLVALAGLALAALPLLGPVVQKLRQPDAPDPVLKDPPAGNRGLARFSMRTLGVLGRTDETARLQAFMQSERRFTWMQIAGVGGQGKSRLGYELVLWAREHGWQAGFLETVDAHGFFEHWNRWQPKRPHLIVFDYVVGREAEIKPVIQAVANRADEFQMPIRVLLLERQRWDRGGVGSISTAGNRKIALRVEGRADWFLALNNRADGHDQCLEATRFENGVLELKKLSEADLVDIVRQVAHLGGSGVRLSDTEIAERLRKIDSAGRPLYAYFLGQVLESRQPIPLHNGGGSTWTRDNLLDEILARDRLTRWQNVLGTEVPSLGDGQPSERLAVIATIAGEVDCRDASVRQLILSADADTRRKALILVDGPMGSGVGGPSQSIPALQPDLLGEWFVLRAVEMGLALDDCIGMAWRIDPDHTAAFLARLAQDFPDHHVSERLLSFEMPDATSAKALAQVATDVAWSLYDARCAVPLEITAALARAATGGDNRAMNWLGVCYARGDGVERDLDQAVAWYLKSAEAGYPGAMVNLGACYARGDGVERDLDQAVAWYRKGAEAGDGRAMSNLGACYERGERVERDLDQAVAWYRKGAAAGDGLAMSNLGGCYARGEGVERDLEQAVAWVRKGAEAGFGRAMYNLGCSYARGEGVERDLEQAVAWYRKGAEAGDGGAMSNLGVCYERGEGVERDLEQAVAWYRKGAAAGDGRAMGNLGFCYWSGEGVGRDLDQAVAWVRKGAEAGFGGAMYNLGFCYERGEGVERDLDQAVAWYRKGAEAGDEEAEASLARLLAPLSTDTER